ncbi:hypothetical protein QA089_001519 [Meyerozyma guilliermondii]
MNSSISIQTAPPYVPRSSSFTNVKKASQQHLAHSLRSNRIDTPTNINIQHLTPTTSHSPRMASKPTFQSNNILRNSSSLSIASAELPVDTPTHHNSDSNPSSLSNYTLNRSMSNTPQTSINTSVDDVGNPLTKTPKSDPSSDISKSNSLESIRETEVNTITSSDAVSSQKSFTISKPVLSSVDSEESSSFESAVEPNLSTLEEEADKASIPDTHTVTIESLREHEYPEANLDMDSVHEVSEASYEPSPETENQSEVTPVDPNGVSGSGSGSDNDSDHGDDTNSGNSQSECDSASSRTLNETHSYEENAAAKSNRDESASDGPANNVPEEPENVQSDKGHSDEHKLGSSSSNKNGLTISVPTKDEIASLPSPNDLKTPKDRITASSSTKSFESVSRLIEGYSNDYESSPNGSVKTPKTNFFDFHKDDAFDRFLNDEQGTPPRGDVAVVGNKIRKHERSVSSISSFNEVLNESKRNSQYGDMGSPIPHDKRSHKVSPDRNSLPPPDTSIIGSSPQSSKNSIISSNPNLTAKEAPMPPIAQVQSEQSEISHSELLSTPKDKDVEITDSVIKGMPLESSPEPPTPISKDNTPKKVPTVTRSMLDVVEDVVEKKPEDSATKKEFTINVPKYNKDFDKALPLSPTVKPKGIITNEKEETQKPKSPVEPKAPSPRKSPSKPKSLPNLSPSTSTSNFKSFWKKFKGDKQPVSKPQTKERTEKKISFFAKVPKFRQSEERLPVVKEPIVAPVSQPPAREQSLVRNSIYDLTLTKLPTIEADSSLLDDVLNSFNETMGSDRAKAVDSDGVTMEPFLRDDELTRDQIEDQQKRDQIPNDEAEDENEANNEEGSSHSQDNSDEAYIDENLRYLQEELLWPIDSDFKALEDPKFPARRKSYDTIRRSMVFDAEPDSETFVLENYELKNLFDNTTEQQRKRLPFHLKHIGQFTDFDRLEISAEKFSMTPVVPKPKPCAAMAPILKTSGTSKPRRSVEFSRKISITETFSPDFYKRYNKSVTQYTLTESLEILKIKSELNTYKCNEMLVHEESQQNTHFFY